jgi:hypothetical protein
MTVSEAMPILSIVALGILCLGFVIGDLIGRHSR